MSRKVVSGWLVMNCSSRHGLLKRQSSNRAEPLRIVSAGEKYHRVGRALRPGGEFLARERARSAHQGCHAGVDHETPQSKAPRGDRGDRSVGQRLLRGGRRSQEGLRQG